MARYRANAARRVPALDVDVKAAFDSCGSSPEALREFVLGHRRSVRWALDAELSQALTGRGHDVRELTARELTARVADLSVCELLQTIAMGRKDATIDVFHGALASRIWCTGGEIVDATSGGLAGEAALYRIMAVEQGEIVADFRPVRRARVVSSPTQALMLEALRRKDECAVLEKRLGGLQQVFSAAPAARATAAAGGLHASLLEAFEGGARIESVLASSAVDDLTMLQAIAQLVESRALVAVDPSPTLVLPPLPSALQVPPANRVTPERPARARKLDWRVRGGAALLALGVLTAALLLLRTPRDSEVPVYTTEASEVEPAPEAEPAPDVEAAPAEESDRVATAIVNGVARLMPASGSDVRDGSYPVHVVVEPAGAQLWLDGAWIATGELSIRLRSGETHELRITAPEHHPQTLLFRDTPPPRAIRLVPLDEHATVGGAVDVAPAPLEPARPEGRSSRPGSARALRF